MADKFNFLGTVVRVEQDGFGIVRFDGPLNANTHGFFSVTSSDMKLPLRFLKPGVHVAGTAQSSDKDLAEVTTLQLQPV